LLSQQHANADQLARPAADQEVACPRLGRPVRRRTEPGTSPLDKESGSPCPLGDTPRDDGCLDRPPVPARCGACRPVRSPRRRAAEAAVVSAAPRERERGLAVPRAARNGAGSGR
jgi:hypothetical protein